MKRMVLLSYVIVTNSVSSGAEAKLPRQGVLILMNDDYKFSMHTGHVGGERNIIIDLIFCYQII